MWEIQTQKERNRQRERERGREREGERERESVSLCIVYRASDAFIRERGSVPSLGKKKFRRRHFCVSKKTN